MIMRSIFRNIFVSVLALSAATACVDDRNNFMVDDSFGFNNAIDDNVTELAIYAGSYELAVIKSGKGFTGAEVFIEASNSDLLAYNKEHNKNYIPVPQDCYSFSTNSLTYSAEEVTKNVTVTWDVLKISDFMKAKNEPSNEYVIPISLKSEDLEVNDGRHIVLLNLKKTNVSVEQSLLSWTVTYGEEVTALTENKSISLLLDRAPGKDLTLEFAADTDAVAAYNEANGVNYALAPEGLISFDKSLAFTNGELIKQLPVTLNTAVLINNGTMDAFEGYVVPVHVCGSSIDGIEYENALTYVVVKGMEPIPPQLFERVWGLYTTSSASVWDANIGLTDARNITMDDQYIYVPQNAAGTPVLKAISIADPSVVKDVNVTGIGGKATELHALSCVRMLPTANGDVLMACNLTGGEDDFTFYIWHDGIDNAPKSYIVSPSGRRLGDKFIVTGTWEAGEVYCKDYNTSNVVRYALLGNDVGEWRATVSYARARYDYSGVVADANTIGSAYVYPGTEGAGSAAIPSFLITSTSNGYFLTNNETLTGTDLGLKMTHGYNFFTSGENKYISYITIDDDTCGGFVKVIADPAGTPEGLMGVLQNQELIFEAPIQDAMDPAVNSPVPASHSTGDCVVREINGEVYMAAMIQHVGLSLFKMNR